MENRIGDLMSEPAAPAQHIHPQPVKATSPSPAQHIHPQPVKATSPSPAQPVVQEASYSPSQPKFMIRCQKCRWAVVNGGTTPELQSLHEIPNNCPTCGKARQFRCPQCGRPAKMTRVKGG